MGKRGPARKQAPPTTIRLDPALKAQIESAARASRRTPAEEIRTRLRSSFGSFQIDDPRTQALAALIADALDIIKAHEGHAWHETQRSFKFAQDSVVGILQWFNRQETSEVPDDHPLIAPLKAQGLSADDIARMKKRLEESELGSLAAVAAIARCERASDDGYSQFDDRYGSAPQIVKQMLKDVGNDGEAIKALKQKGLALFAMGETRRVQANLPPEAHLPPKPIKRPRRSKGDKQ
jgi:hypothetical protein